MNFYSVEERQNMLRVVITRPGTGPEFSFRTRYPTRPKIFLLVPPLALTSKSMPTNSHCTLFGTFWDQILNWQTSQVINIICPYINSRLGLLATLGVQFLVISPSHSSKKILKNFIRKILLIQYACKKGNSTIFLVAVDRPTIHNRYVRCLQ